MIESNWERHLRCRSINYMLNRQVPVLATRVGSPSTRCLYTVGKEDHIPEGALTGAYVRFCGGELCPCPCPRCVDGRCDADTIGDQ